MSKLSKVKQSIAYAQGWLSDAASTLEEPKSAALVEVASDDRKAMDIIFGPPTVRMAYNPALFVRVADDESLLIRKCERDLWALSEDGSSVVRLYDPAQNPMVVEKTASVEERDAIRLVATMERDRLIQAGEL